jgi:hypothetical protein
MHTTLPPVPLYLTMRGINSFAFALILTYELAYHTVVLGLTPLQLARVGGTTLISGSLPDQAALYGLLLKLDRLGLTLISVASPDAHHSSNGA